MGLSGRLEDRIILQETPVEIQGQRQQRRRNNVDFQSVIGIEATRSAKTVYSG
jgi:hypothetical protein